MGERRCFVCGSTVAAALGTGVEVHRVCWPDGETRSWHWHDASSGSDLVLEEAGHGRCVIRGPGAATRLFRAAADTLDAADEG